DPHGSTLVAAEQAIRFAPFPFGGATGPAIAPRHGCKHFLRGRRRAAVDQALGGDRRADPFGDDPLHDDDAFDAAYADTHLVAGPHRLSGFRGGSVDSDVATT